MTKQKNEKIDKEKAEQAQKVVEAADIEAGDMAIAEEGGQMPEPQTVILEPEAEAEREELIKALDKGKLKAVESERDEFKNALIRERADFENYKKRNSALSSASYQNGVADAITALLPTLDNFERALGTECADKKFADGIDMIRRQLNDALKGLGLTEIDTAVKFDPNLHNAVAQDESDGHESGDITEVLQKGYMLGDKVLRHASVKVGK